MEREEREERPAERIEPDDATPTDDGPSDSDLRPSSDTEHVVEERGEGEPER